MIETDGDEEDSDDPLDSDMDVGDHSIDTIPCPFCRKPVYEQADICPHCRNYIARDSAPNRPRWIILTALALLAALLIAWARHLI